MIPGLTQIIEAHVDETVRERVAQQIAQIEQQQEAERWNRILNSILMERKHGYERNGI